MSFAQMVGLVIFTLSFGAALVFAFDRALTGREFRREFAPVHVAKTPSPAAGGLLPPSTRMEGMSRRVMGYGDAAGEPSSVPVAVVHMKFEICGRVRRNCVVDGDTFWIHGEKVRIADIDTPEIHQPRCTDEHRLGLAATVRLVELLNDGPFELRQVGERRVDRYGRKLLLVVREGSSLGDELVSEGLAHRWIGTKVSWCN